MAVPKCKRNSGANPESIGVGSGESGAARPALPFESLPAMGWNQVM